MNKQEIKVHYEYRRKNNLCVRCGAKVEGNKYCVSCRTKNRLRVRQARLTKRAADGGVCACKNFDFIKIVNGKCVACGLPRRR